MVTKKQREEQWDLWNKRLRDLGLYFLGIFLAYNEFLVEPEVRVPAVVFIASVLSLPMAARIDEALRKKDDSDAAEGDK